MEFLVVGLPAAAVVVAVVELLKRLLKWGDDSDAPIVAAIVTAVALSVANHLSGTIPVFAEWWGVVIGGLLLGFGAMGFFDLADAALSKIKIMLPK